MVAVGLSLSVGTGLAEPTAADLRPWVPAVDSSRDAGVVTLYFENDYFGGSDRHYTNGLKVAWLSADRSGWEQDGWRQRFAEGLPMVNRTVDQKNVGVAFGQAIYTPQNTRATIPDLTDRPYAGWSYLEFAFVSKTPFVADTLAFQVGMVGRHSYAQDTQRIVHEWVNSTRPNGWEYQLHDEIGVNLVFERRWRHYGRTLGDTFGADLIPHLGLSLGNVQTHANVGGTVRFGVNLPSDFGVELVRGSSMGAGPMDSFDPRVASDRSWSVFLFAGADGRVVGRDIFLDGNTFRDSPSVDKETLVGDLSLGFGIIAGRWQLTFTQVRRTKEFKSQPKPFNDFGSVTLSRAI